MKLKTNITIAMIAVLALGLFSCSKYEEGPALSFRSLKERLSNTWKFDSYTINGIEKKGESMYSSQKQFWYPSGQLEITFINPADNSSNKIDGSWFVFDDNKKVSVVKNKTNSTQKDTTTYLIIKAKEQSVWLRTPDAEEEIHFVPLN